MSVELCRPGATVVERVVLALEGVPGEHDASVQRRALMYAEAIDDADEDDVALRFGPKLQTCLALLGVTFPAGTLSKGGSLGRRARLAA
jgi:hypothetical protein